MIVSKHLWKVIANVYYGAKYPGHNLARAKNQLLLLHRLQEQKKYFDEVLNTLS